MPITSRLVIIIAKIITQLIRWYGIGVGATWPGELALRVRPDILTEFGSLALNLILVTGTNGKTTTAKLIETILKSHGLKVLRNTSGANLDNGIASALTRGCDWAGRIKPLIGVFEVDEAAFPAAIIKLNPKIVVILNLFRDQLDRYGELDAIADKWLRVLSAIDIKTIVLLNGDDPQLVFIGASLTGRVSYFGIDDPTNYLDKMQHAVDSIYCPGCGQRLTYGGVYFSHLGVWACGRCGLTHPELAVNAGDFHAPVDGVYNKYNVAAAALTAKHLGLLNDEIQTGLNKFTPAFGRGEILRYKGKNAKILLSKNPTGFNETLRTMLNSPIRGPLLLVLNDRIPDGKDVSWIWDVDFELLNQSENKMTDSNNHKIFISGDRCFDMALRLKYAGIKKEEFSIYPDLNKAINQAIMATGDSELLWILPTYTAMLDVRQAITGKSIDN